MKTLGYINMGKQNYKYSRNLGRSRLDAVKYMLKKDVEVSVNEGRIVAKAYIEMKEILPQIKESSYDFFFGTTNKKISTTIIGFGIISGCVGLVATVYAVSNHEIVKHPVIANNFANFSVVSIWAANALLVLGACVRGIDFSRIKRQLRLN